MKDRSLLPLLFIGGGVLAFFAFKDSSKKLSENIKTEKLFFEIKTEEDWNYIKNNEDKFKPLYWIVYPGNSNLDELKENFSYLYPDNSVIFIEESDFNNLSKK